MERDSGRAADLKTLSLREREAFQLFCGGRLLRDIAAEMGVSVQTVRFHLGKVYEKLDLAYLDASARREELRQYCADLTGSDLALGTGG